MLQLQQPVRRGDGIVFDAGRPQEAEQGGAVYDILPAGGSGGLESGSPGEGAGTRVALLAACCSRTAAVTISLLLRIADRLLIAGPLPTHCRRYSAAGVWAGCAGPARCSTGRPDMEEPGPRSGAPPASLLRGAASSQPAAPAGGGGGAGGAGHAAAGHTHRRAGGQGRGGRARGSGRRSKLRLPRTVVRLLLCTEHAALPLNRRAILVPARQRRRCRRRRAGRSVRPTCRKRLGSTWATKRRWPPPPGTCLPATLAPACLCRQPQSRRRAGRRWPRCCRRGGRRHWPQQRGWSRSETCWESCWPRSGRQATAPMTRQLLLMGLLLLCQR